MDIDAGPRKRSRSLDNGENDYENDPEASTSCDDPFIVVVGRNKRTKKGKAPLTQPVSKAMDKVGVPDAASDCVFCAKKCNAANSRNSVRVLH